MTASKDSGRYSFVQATAFLMFELFKKPVLQAVLVCAGAAIAAAQPPAETHEIKPPFKLSWGETAERLELLLAGAKAKIVERKKLEDGREAWTVEDLVQAGLKRSKFYFRGGSLVEVELQYQKDEWDQGKYDEYMGQVRRSIERRYGQGQLIARKTEPQGDVMQTVVGYKWNRNNTSIELIYYSAQDGTQVFRTLSVHYKGN